MKPQDIYAKITNDLIALLEQGEIPWRKPWIAGAHKNLVSKKAYRGINQLSLQAAAVRKGFSAPYWLTFLQCQQAGGKVKSGEKSSLIVKWSWFREKKKDSDEIDPNGKKWANVKYYNVFNVAQCDGIDAPAIVTPEIAPLDHCEQIIENMPTRPPIVHIDTTSAFYSPLRDVVNVPPRTVFDNAEFYYSVMFHELAHSTGHTSRLNRKEVMDLNRFGSHDYSQEELCAESCAAFLCGMTGIAPATITNSAAYLQSWLKALRNDRTCLIYGIQRGQAAADFILGEDHAEDETTEA